MQLKSLSKFINESKKANLPDEGETVVFGVSVDDIIKGKKYEVVSKVENMQIGVSIGKKTIILTQAEYREYKGKIV